MAQAAFDFAVLTPRELLAQPGFKEAVALYLNPPKRSPISSWSALNDYLKSRIIENGREEFRVLFLDKKNHLIADEVMGVGTVDHAPVYPREIARRALELDASSLILTHNHPSGDPTPSAADIDMTKQIVDALKPLRIAVHDHVIAGAHGVLSLKTLGVM